MRNSRHTGPTTFRFGILVLFFPVFVLLQIVIQTPGIPWAVQATLLGDKHKEAGISCDGCHKESPPREKVPTSSCQGCHGDYRSLAERTAKTDPNPHASHEGELPCENCHHSHKPSVDRCAKCHNFGLKVP